MKVLVACEESQAVTKEFRKRGHEAYSCDTEPCSGGHPEWHLQQDVARVLGGYGTFKLENGDIISVLGWDVIIAFPPCTYITTAGVRWFNEERYGDKARERKRLRALAIEFVLSIYNSKCDKVVIENPRGYLSTMWRKPDQIIQPWQFGDEFNKPTCLWIKGLPKLVHTKIVSKGEMVSHVTKKGKIKTDSKWYTEAIKIKDNKERSKFRSKTFPGIAKAMAEQWGNIA